VRFIIENRELSNKNNVIRGGVTRKIEKIQLKKRDFSLIDNLENQIGRGYLLFLEATFSFL